MLIFIMSFEFWTFGINVFVKVMDSFFYVLTGYGRNLSQFSEYIIKIHGQYMLLIEETMWRSFEKIFGRYDS